MPSIGSTTQCTPGPTALPPCSSPSTVSPGRRTGEPVAHERLDRGVRCGDDVGRRALRGHPDAVGPVSALPRPGSPRRWVAASTATRSATRRSSRGSSESVAWLSARPSALSTAPFRPGDSLCADGRWQARSRGPSDHMTAHRDAREAEGSTSLIAPLQCRGTRNRDGLRHQRRTRSAGRRHLDRQPEAGVRRPVSGKRTVARGPSGSRRSRKPQRHHRRPTGVRPGAPPPFAGGCGGEDRHEGGAEGQGRPARQEGGRRRAEEGGRGRGRPRRRCRDRGRSRRRRPRRP